MDFMIDSKLEEFIDSSKINLDSLPNDAEILVYEVLKHEIPKLKSANTGLTHREQIAERVLDLMTYIPAKMFASYAPLQHLTPAEIYVSLAHTTLQL